MNRAPSRPMWSIASPPTAQASTATGNALLYESLRRQYRRIAAIEAISQLVRETVESPAQLGPIVDAIARSVDCASGTLSIVRGPYLCECTPSRNAESVARSGRPSLVHDRRGDAIAVPLVDELGTYGVLEVRTPKRRSLDLVDLETIVAIAQQLTMAMKNAELQRASREIDVLRRADRLKSEFLATVSHDLRSPLTAIRASVDGLLDRPPNLPAEPASEFLHTISNQVNRLTRLVDQLLDVSQIEAGGLRLDREWNELSAMLAYAVADITTLHGPNRIDYRLPVDAPLLFVDHDRFIQVLYNLLDNACKHASGTGPITIETSWTDASVTVGVADRGTGTPLDGESIFKRFYRGEDAKHGVRGIGLGLAICRGIVEAHGGTIRVDERAGGGAAFRFNLPLVPSRDLQPVA